ncbi:hypothetical protein ACYSNU_00920 [Enterococcus sp. LJL120]
MKLKRTIIGYLSITAFLFVFQLIYHRFSHGVTSIGLEYVWVIPLIGGLLIILLNGPLKTLNNRLAFNLYNIALAVCINAVIIQGILDIAGSDTPYLRYYYFIALPMLALSLVFFVGDRLFVKVK